jgi:exonuclease SbcC
VTIPVFDGGRRDAAQRAAAAVYDDAAARYRAALRQAVREVEEALVRIGVARARDADTRQAAQSLAEVLRAKAEEREALLKTLFETVLHERASYWLEEQAKSARIAVLEQNRALAVLRQQAACRLTLRVTWLA